MQAFASHSTPPRLSSFWEIWIWSPYYVVFSILRRCIKWGPEHTLVAAKAPTTSQWYFILFITICQILIVKHCFDNKTMRLDYCSTLLRTSEWLVFQGQIARGLFRPVANVGALVQPENLVNGADFCIWKQRGGAAGRVQFSLHWRREREVKRGWYSTGCSWRLSSWPSPAVLSLRGFATINRVPTMRRRPSTR